MLTVRIEDINKIKKEILFLMVKLSINGAKSP